MSKYLARSKSLSQPPPAKINLSTLFINFASTWNEYTVMNDDNDNVKPNQFFA